MKKIVNKNIPLSLFPLRKISWNIERQKNNFKNLCYVKLEKISAVYLM